MEQGQGNIRFNPKRNIEIYARPDTRVERWNGARQVNANALVVALKGKLFEDGMGVSMNLDNHSNVGIGVWSGRSYMQLANVVDFGISNIPGRNSRKELKESE